MGQRTNSLWSEEPAGRPLRPAGFAICAAAELLAAVPLAPAAAANPDSVEASAVAAGPQWVTPDQRAATHFIALLQNADLDGLDPKLFKVKPLVRALSAASSGNLKAADKANAAFDQA